ncbi:hypothetical protein GCM10007067_16730 [Lysobacter bugurensis]|uniref:Uncharacterized protein n=1 Tax=Cognatilysobacter bugurensis TaxID=543356 RepID=A0A918W862_9GAMM|nr:hypothetical protein GCM10007067_16730 [Lysobacter bugurensis]
MTENSATAMSIAMAAMTAGVLRACAVAARADLRMESSGIESAQG